MCYDREERPGAMPKTDFLQIRMTPDDRRRLHRAAAGEFMADSTWARRAILQALAQWEDERARSGRHTSAGPQSSDAPPIRRVAESKPPKRPK